jgi:hypothetical protein
MADQKKRNYEINEVLNDKQQEMYDEWKSHIKSTSG